MKRFFATVLVLAMALSMLAACQKTPDASTAEPTEQTEPLPALEGTVTITGDGKEDTILTAQTSVAQPFYQWLVDGVPMDNANAETFQVPVNAAGKEITVSVGAEGYGNAIVSDPITAVANSSDFKSMAGMYHASKILGRVFFFSLSGFFFMIHTRVCGVMKSIRFFSVYFQMPWALC